MPYSLYLAGPEVFLPNAREVVDEQRRVCRSAGLTPISPLDKGDGPGDQTVSRQDRIFAGNIALIHAADAIVANVQPFRGPDPDAGTAFEVGYAHALGKPIYLWAEDVASNRERVERAFGPLHRRADGMLADRDGLMVEDFGGPVNLMLVSPATVVLGSFAACIARVAEDVRIHV
ncbi:nucleoside 2-deoxyribosyltransferase [Amnibacterium kyonggiense]|uniref:Nucleoside 2-deoxyribosyltransferase n=1 Tax=Amnibacterium kyonggiense TaxID=595671 RepID=A0A4R7FLC4_9MICO|nr:nucleoside 2-deoxyribosyltransferase [Amnibacterium kyonggiense]TDS77212.1 nucleoside 2-deoxyribosyltransferase [Amnibacterium kyonggiense]